MPLVRVLICLVVLVQLPRLLPADLPRSTPKDVAADAASKAPAGQTRPTVAERIAGLERLLAADRQREQDLRRLSEELQRDFEARSADFTSRDSRVTAERAELEHVPPEERKAKRANLEKLEQEREAARAEFDRTISRRKAVQEQLEVLSEKIALEEKGLERLKSAEPESRTPPPSTPSTDAAAPAGTKEGKQTDSAQPESTATSPPSRNGSSATPGDREAAADGSGGTEPRNQPAVEAEPVVAARRDLQSRKQRLDQAKSRVQILDESILVFERDLQSAERLLEITRQEAESAARSVEAQERVLQKRNAEGAPEAEIASADEALIREKNRLEETRSEIAFQTTRVNESRQLLERLKESRSEAAEVLAQAAESVRSAETRLALLESPVAPHRIGSWVRNTGPNVLGLVLILLIVWWLARVVARRAIGALVRRSRRGSSTEREERAETLQRVFRYAVSMAVLTLGLLAVLHTSGIDVSVLFGGAAVLGAAVAFGSQNLIKDYFTGFMVLAENQYSVGNVVRIADTTGVVEDISLRVTVLRDEEGTVHFIPHSQVTKVSNMTHGWSRAVFQIPVGYRENLDKVMELLLDLAKEMRDDAVFGPQMLGQPEMQGVESLGESAVVVKFLVKTRPRMQWGVKREMLRRIKTEFDRRGIQIPYPQLVMHQADDDPQPPGGTDRAVAV